MKVYVCYSRNDSPIVLPICEKLKKKGVQIGVENESLKAGEDIAYSLTQAIDTADNILFFYSQSAEKSAWVRREIEYAINKGKSITPILLNECPETSWFGHLIEKYDSIFLYKGDDIVERLFKSCNYSDGEGSYNPPSSPMYSPIPSRKSNNKKTILVFVSLSVLFLGILASIVFRGNSYLSNAKNVEYEKVAKTRDSIEDLIKVRDGSLHSLNRTGAMRCETENKAKKERIDAIKGMIEREPEIKDVDNLVTENNELKGQIKEYRQQYFLLQHQVEKQEKEILNLLDETINLYMYIYFSLLVLGILFVLLIIFVILYFKDRKKVKQVSELTSISLASSPIILKCFIAGSKALQRERDALRSVISIMYNKWSRRNFRIMAYTYEDFDKSIVAGGHQTKYNQFIRKETDWAIFVIDGQVGGITLEEYQNAMAAYKENGRPKILVLAKIGSHDTAEIKLVKDEINREQQYWTDYSDINSLKNIFETILNWDLINLYM